ncbi:MAG: class I SAM-dependent methyltransferase [Patescibacteria group bacterium]
MFADPVSNLKQFGLKEDMVVADLGAGTGFYSVAAGAMVPRGKVYAVEVQKDFLPTIKKKAQDAHLNNVECFWGNIEKIGGTKIGNNIVDAVIVSNVLFQVEDRDKFLEEVKRILKRGGRVLLIDWSDASSALGPNFNTVISQSKAREMFEQKGFVWQREINAGSHHYGMILERS